VSWDKTARVWAADGAGPPVVLAGHQDRVVSAAWSPDGKHIVTVSEDATARLWSADGTGTPVVLGGRTGSKHPHGYFSRALGDQSSAAWSPDGKRILTAYSDNQAWVWNAEGKGGPITVLRGANDAFVRSAAWSPDGKRIVTASEDGTAQVWSADDGGPEVRDARDSIRLVGHKSSVRTAAWSPDGKRILTASGDGTTRVWNADGTGTPVVLDDPQGQYGLVAAWSPDGRRFVTVTIPEAKVWNADGTGPEIVLLKKDAPAAAATFAAWSPDGERLLVTYGDGTARIWPGTLPALQRALRDATTDCLTPEQRQTYLVESDSEARDAYEACERTHGRTPFYADADKR
jgi:WD40 repeat protein